MAKLKFLFIFLAVIFTVGLIYILFGAYKNHLAARHQVHGIKEMNGFHFNKAVQEFQKSISVQPKNFKSKLLYATTLGDEGKFSNPKDLYKAVRALKKLKKNRGLSKLEKTRVTFYLGKFYFILGSHRFADKKKKYIKKAAANFLQIIQNPSQNRTLLAEAAYAEGRLLLLDKKKYSQAFSYFKQAEKNWDSQNRYFPESYIAMIELKNGNKLKAYQSYFKIVSGIKKEWLSKMKIQPNSFPQILYGRYYLTDWLTYDILWHQTHQSGEELNFPKKLIPNNIPLLKSRWGSNVNHIMMNLQLYLNILKAVQLREKHKIKEAVLVLKKSEAEINAIPSYPSPPYLFSARHSRAEELKALLYAWMAELEKELGEKQKASYFRNKSIRASKKGIDIFAELG